MSKQMSQKYVGPVTGRVYDLAAGEKIDAEAEGIGVLNGSRAPGCGPKGRVDGREVYNRILVRRRRPEEILAGIDPNRSVEELQRQCLALALWFRDFAGKDVELIFGVRELEEDE